MLAAGGPCHYSVSHDRLRAIPLAPMSDERKKPGPVPEVFKVPLPFKKAVEAALKTAPPKNAGREKKQR